MHQILHLLVGNLSLRKFRLNQLAAIDSNEVEVLAILEGLYCFSRNFNGVFIVDSDSSNAIAWMTNQKSKGLSFTINVHFRCELRSANYFFDALAKY